MKQNYIHKIAVLFIALCTTFSAYAYDFSNDDIHYNIISKEEHSVAIVGCNIYINTLNIPNKVTYKGDVYKVIEIAAYAFRDCSRLTTIALPSSLTSIGSSAFSGCSGLTTIALPSSLTSIGSDAFRDCSRLTRIALPSSLTSIGSSAFSGCSSLTTIELPSSLTSIGKEAFSDCPITSFIIPASVTEISGNPVENCRELAILQVEKENTKFIAIDNVLYNKDITKIIACAAKEVSVSLPNTVTEIAESAFYGCSSLTTIDLPSSITSIGNYAFRKCRSLTTIALPSSITSIGNYAFGDCSSLTTIALPSSLISIGSSAFIYCSSLTTIALPSSLTSIGSDAFNGCSSLTTIALPSSLTSIGSSAFLYCRSLTTIALPSSITTIGYNAFSGCSGLTTIDLPSSLIEIGRGAFDCTNLSEVTCRAQTPPSADAKYNIFSDNTYRKGILKVPAESVSQYEISYPWGQFWNIEGISTSGIKDVNVSKTDVTVRNTGIGNIVLENADGMAVSVYSVDGAVMYQTSEYDGQNINIGSGIYVVKCGASVLKVRL